MPAVRMWRLANSYVRHKTALCLLSSLGLCTLVMLASFQSVDYSIHRLQPLGHVKSQQDIQSELAESIDIFSGVGLNFLPNFKNPCWYDRQGTLPRRENLFASILKSSSAAELVNHQHYNKRSYMLRCLPYFLLIGQPKCATTDVFQRISIHPDVAGTLLKGPHWWTRRRFGQPYSSKPVTFSEYLDLFNTAAAIIESKLENSTTSSVPYHHMITGDGSTSTLWDSSPTMNYLYSILNKETSTKLLRLFFNKREGSSVCKRKTESSSNETSKHHKSGDCEGCCFSSQVSKDDYNEFERTEYDQLYSIQPGAVLPITAADIIHAVLPRARVIAVVREPISRLYSSYAFFTKKQKISPESFEIAVTSSIQKWNDCTARYSERTCAYNKTLQYSLEVRLYNGMYSVFLRDWLTVFPEEQILVIRMEDYHQDRSATMASIYAHLGLRGLSEEEEKLVNMAPVQNKNKKKGHVGKMLNATAETLRKFYARFNDDLANLLKDPKYMWKDYTGL